MYTAYPHSNIAEGSMMPLPGLLLLYVVSLYCYHDLASKKKSSLKKKNVEVSG
jgi:hypothetical protein